MLDLLNPKEIAIIDRKGKERKYIISEIPAVTSREIVAQYPTSALPKVGDYGLNEQMMFKMLSYVSAIPENSKIPVRLQTRELIDNHVPDLKTLSALEIEMAKYNWDFFLPEDLSLFWGRIRLILATFFTQVVTDSLRQSSEQVKPPSTSSGPFTA